MHAFGVEQGLPKQDKTTFHKGEASCTTKATGDSIMDAKIEKPWFENSVANSSLSLQSLDT